MPGIFSALDLALALRLMRKQPILTATLVCALAIGIGMATTGFTFLEAVVWGRLPFSGGDRFVIVDVYAEPDGRRASIDDDRFRALRAGASSLQHLGAFHGSAQNLQLPSGEVMLVPAVAITPDTFQVLPFAPLHGRTLRGEDAQSGAAPVALLRESVWRRHFSADPAVIGSVAILSGMPRTIVGVMPDATEFPTSPEIWIPLQDTTGAAVFGVVTTTATVALAAEQVHTLSNQFERAYPAAPRLRLVVAPFVEALSRGLDLLNTALVAVLVMVLIVISANIANLVLARTISRRNELAVRTALGATRARLVGQVFLEVLAIGAVAAAIGLFASQATLRWIRLTLTDMPFWVDLSASPRTMLFVVVSTLLAAAVGGAWPALRATRRDPAAALASSGQRVATAFSRSAIAMIALQIALSIAALQAAFVVAKGVAGYMEGMPNAPAWEVVTARVVLPREADPAIGHERVLQSVGALPQVHAAGLSTSLPRLSPPTVMTAVRDTIGGVESEWRAAPSVAVSVGLFETLGASALSGRLFTPADFQSAAAPVAIVNQPFVEKFFRGASAVGRQLRVADPDDPSRVVWREIVGVVPDLGLSAGDERLAAGFYLPLASETVFHLAVAVRGDAAALMRSLRGHLTAADPRIQVLNIIPLEQVGAEDRAVFAGIGAALTGLGGIALLLSIMGIYAMLSFSVTERTREIAIRTALGATRMQVLVAVLGRAAIPLIAGAIAGPLLGALLITARGIFAFRLPADAGPWAVSLVCGVMLVAGAIAAWVPGRRLVRMNPAEALRAD